MAFNYGLAYRVFLKELADKHILYAQLGLRQDQVDALDEYDWSEFHSNCVFYFHNTAFDFRDDIDEGADAEIISRLTVDDPASHIDSRMNGYSFSWMNEISSISFMEKLLKLPVQDLVMLDEYVFEGKTQKELSEEYGIAQQNISKRLRRIKNDLKK